MAPRGLGGTPAGRGTATPRRVAPAGSISDTLAAVIVNLWRYRRFIIRNALSDVRYRYAGSAAGVAWNVINPLAQILIYSLVFSQIMVIQSPRVAAGGTF